MGGKVSGAGTDTIKIEGVKKLHGTEFEIMDDYIEAGTYLIAGAMAGGTVEVTGNFVNHLKPVLATLAESGAEMDIAADRVTIHGSPHPRPVNITTMPYPGFPTDMQAQMMAYLCRARGSAVVHETIYPDRFNHVQELLRLGADIKQEDSTAIVTGVESLSGAYVMASDLRASAALILAGLVASGETHIRRIYHIDRGYERIEDKLQSLGAKIQRQEE
jgi:UDP-N-acetylglucosamine 1-carboxyvinyltransferase